MRIFTKKTLRTYWEQYPDAEDVLNDWYRTALRARWDSPAAVTERYPNASIVGDSRVVFRFKGGRYRMVVRMDYRYGEIFIRFVGNHSEYDRINVMEV